MSLKWDLGISFKSDDLFWGSVVSKILYSRIFENFYFWDDSIPINFSLVWCDEDHIYTKVIIYIGTIQRALRVKILDRAKSAKRRDWHLMTHEKFKGIVLLYLKLTNWIFVAPASKKKSENSKKNYMIFWNILVNKAFKIEVQIYLTIKQQNQVILMEK